MCWHGAVKLRLVQRPSVKIPALTSLAMIKSAAFVGGRRDRIDLWILGVFRRLIRRIDTGEVLDPRRAAPFIEALHITFFSPPASGVSTNTSINSSSATRSRAIRRSARNGEMNRHQHDQSSIHH